MRVLVGLFAIAACTGEQGRPELDEQTPEPPHLAASPGLRIDEIAAAGEPNDWFEVVNVSDAPVELGELVFVDVQGDFVRARRLPDTTLAPGARHVEDLTRETTGFALGKADALWIYRADDRVLIDHVSWNEGASPKHRSYARTSSGFVTGRPTRGLPGEAAVTAER